MNLSVIMIEVVAARLAATIFKDIFGESLLSLFLFLKMAR